MLSTDELNNGTVFVLKLGATPGGPSLWAETLRGDAARHWYDIHRRSDWAAVRAEAAGVFRNPVTTDEAAAILRRYRCVLLHARGVAAADLAAAPVAC